MEISNGKAKSVKMIDYNVKSFCITEKGNVYYLNEFGDLHFYKESQGKSVRFASEVVNIQFYTYKNTLYFDSVDENTRRPWDTQCTS